MMGCLFLVCKCVKTSKEVKRREKNSWRRNEIERYINCIYENESHIPIIWQNKVKNVLLFFLNVFMYIKYLLFLLKWICLHILLYRKGFSSSMYCWLTFISQNRFVLAKAQKILRPISFYSQSLHFEHSWSRLIMTHMILKL